MEKILADAVIVAAGAGTRAGLDVPKQFFMVDGMPVVCHSIFRFLNHSQIMRVVTVLPQDSFEESVKLIRRYCQDERIIFVPGGNTRMQSVENGLKYLVENEHEDVVCIHDAVRMFVSQESIADSICSAAKHGAALTAVPVVDTIKVVREGVAVQTPDRQNLYAAQTPQTFRLELIWDAYQKAVRDGADCTDDCSVAERVGLYSHISMGSPSNKKLTHPEDFMFEKKDCVIRTGIGYDLHLLTEGRRLMLGGVEIPFEKGLLGHSDADVLLHAVTDALLGAAALGDIGKLFPDTDPNYRGANSALLLAEVVSLLQAQGYAIVNVDCNVIAQRPKLQPYIPQIRERIAAILQTELSAVSVKAKTNEGVDATGRGEAIAAQCICLIRQ